MGIIFENVEIARNDFMILSALNFNLSEYQRLVVFGESGSGKSTLVDAIAGRVFPKKGKIIKDKSKKVVLVNRDYNFHRLVGPVYQYYQQRFNAFDAALGPTVYEVLQNQVIPVGTVNQNSVERGLPLYSESWLEEVCENLQIKSLLAQKITSLSNGQTRRTLLALALLQKPDILLLDNPFAGLDVNSRKVLKNILGSLTCGQIVLVAQEGNVPSCFTHCMVLEGTKIIFEGERASYSAKSSPTEGLDFSPLEQIPNFNFGSKESFEVGIRLINGKVRYGEKMVLNNVNWCVRRGDKWALMGPNGSGKSSLLSLIVGDNPQCYQNQLYLFDKRRGSGESIWEIKQKIGFVSPELHLYFNKQTTVWKVVASGFFDSAGLFTNLSQKQHEIVLAYLSLLKINQFAERKLGQLSFGQQRLVFLARALVKNPPMLILDEPCQGLDYNQMVFFREILNEIVLRQDKTLVFVTHYEEEIPVCVTKKLYLEEGKVVKIVEND
jgi:molybdate transport system ATP-binding protein